MRKFIGVLAAGFVSLALAHAAGPAEQPDPDVLEARLRKVREQLEKLRAEERALAEQLAEAKASAPGAIKAEVTGVLRHDSQGGCYYVSVRSANGETRIWLPPAGDKVRDHLGTLHGKAVLVTGPMHQRHPAKGVPYVWTEKEIPEGALYLLPFEIKAAPDAGPKK